MTSKANYHNDGNSLNATSHVEFSVTEEMVEQYTTNGGYPPLDMQYTVFGELVEGFDVLDVIAGVDPRTEKVPMIVTPVEDYQAGSN